MILELLELTKKTYNVSIPVYLTIDAIGIALDEPHLKSCPMHPR